MHPEVESHIRKHAEVYVESMKMQNRMFSLALDKGVISSEDLYFLGVVDGAGSVSLQDLVDTGQAPIHEEGGIPFVVQDDPEFRDREALRQYGLVAEIYKCTPKIAEQKWDDIMTKVSEDWNHRNPNR